jgi:hypothetical protein
MRSSYLLLLQGLLESLPGIADVFLVASRIDEDAGLAA